MKRTTIAIVLALAALAACGGPKKNTEHATVPEGSGVPDSCCCKTNPMSSDDGKPVYEVSNPMECSANHGTCVPNEQCNASQKPD